MPLLDKLNNFSIAHFVLAGALLGGLIHFLKMSDHAAVKTKIESVQQEINSSNDQLRVGQSLSAEKPKYEKEIEDTKSILETAKEIMPTSHNQREIIEAINKASKESSISIPYIRPGNTAVKGGSNYDTISYEVELVGTYTNLTRFLFELTKSKYLLVVRNVDFVKTDKVDGKARINTKTAILAFQYRDPNGAKP